MAAEDAVGMQYQLAAKMRAQYEEWERIDVGRRVEHAQMRAAEEEKNRKAYMKMFHESTSSNDIMQYEWPSVPHLAQYFEDSETDLGWWPLDKPLAPDSRSTFHSSKASNGRQHSQ